MRKARAALLLLLCVVLQSAVGFLNSPGGIHSAARCSPSAAICAVLILLSPVRHTSGILPHQWPAGAIMRVEDSVLLSMAACLTHLHLR